MARDEAPPFGRGETFFNGLTTNTTDGANLEGKVYEFEDLDYGTTGVGAKPARSGRYVKCMVVRNVAAFALLPKRLANLTLVGSDGKDYLGQVDGYARLTGKRAYPIDEFLPAAGVPVNDLFYVVVEGPAMVLTPLDAGADNVFNVGDLVTALTAVTSGATTAGRVTPQDLTGATAPLADQIQNRIGHALSAATTANTGANLLVEVGKW